MADAREEQAWHNENSAPQVERDGDTLILWNYPVTGTALPEADKAKIEEFLSEGKMTKDGQEIPMDISVRGHSSSTGEKDSNVRFAEDRAANVEAFIKQNLKYQRVDASGAGSTEPLAKGNSPADLAKNRRVEITKTLLTYEEAVQQPTPPSQPPAPGTRDLTGFETPRTVPIDMELRTLTTPRAIMTASAVGEMQVFIVGKQDPYENGVLTTEGSRDVLTEEFASQLKTAITARTSLEADEDAGTSEIGVALPAEQWFKYPSLVLQDDPRTMRVEFEAVQARLPNIDFHNAKVQMQFNGRFKFDVKPSSLVRRVLLNETPGEPTTKPTTPVSIPMDMGPLLAAAAIVESQKEFSPLAKDKIDKWVLRLATRDGAAARMALAVLGPEAQPKFDERQLAWRNFCHESAAKAFADGAESVKDFLDGQEDLPAKKIDWKTKLGSESFGLTSEHAFIRLKGYETDQTELKTLIEKL